MLRGKLSREEVEMISNCKSVEEVYETLSTFQPDCTMRDAEILYKMFVLAEKE